MRAFFLLPVVIGVLIFLPSCSKHDPREHEMNALRAEKAQADALRQKAELELAQQKDSETLVEFGDKDSPVRISVTKEVKGRVSDFQAPVIRVRVTGAGFDNNNRAGIYVTAHCNEKRASFLRNYYKAKGIPVITPAQIEAVVGPRFVKAPPETKPRPKGVAPPPEYDMSIEAFNYEQKLKKLGYPILEDDGSELGEIGAAMIPRGQTETLLALRGIPLPLSADAAGNYIITINASVMVPRPGETIEWTSGSQGTFTWQPRALPHEAPRQVKPALAPEEVDRVLETSKRFQYLDAQAQSMLVLTAN
jgi:hypothetical protein